MHVVVTGATGNVGTSVVARLAADPAIDRIVGIARRRPAWNLPKVEWIEADVAVDDLVPLFRGADAVVHLAWVIQPTHDQRALWATNVVGSRRVADAVATAGVPALIAASSVGAYAPAPPGTTVDESWPTDGVPESSYSWQKALLERTLDGLAVRAPATRIVRVRPALIFKRTAARGIRKLFIGPFVPLRRMPAGLVARLISRSPIAFQCVHTDDVATAIHHSVTRDVHGAFNLAATGVIGEPRPWGPRLARVVRPGLAGAWRARLVPIDPGWLFLAASVPLLSTARAEAELDWRPSAPADEVLRELLGGFRDDASFETPPLGDGPVHVGLTASG